MIEPTDDRIFLGGSILGGGSEKEDDKENDEEYFLNRDFIPLLASSRKTIPLRSCAHSSNTDLDIHHFDTVPGTYFGNAALQ